MERGEGAGIIRVDCSANGRDTVISPRGAVGSSSVWAVERLPIELFGAREPERDPYQMAAPPPFSMAKG